MKMSDGHARIVSAADAGRCLDSVQLNHLEQVFRAWTEAASGLQRRLSRKRVLLIFLLIRYTGGRLNEVLRLDSAGDIDFCSHVVRLRKSGDEKEAGAGREVQVPEAVTGEIQATLVDFDRHYPQGGIFKVDPAHVRRKFYACAEAAGYARELGTPEAIRRARAVELMQGNVPLPVVQKILGHATPNLAAAYVDFSQEEIRRVERFYIERENRRKTSARNAFYGKIDTIQRGDVQAMLEVVSVEGRRITALITGYSLDKLGLRAGMLIVAEVKAPWVTLVKSASEPVCTAENRLRGTVARIVRGKLVTEVDVRVSDTIELCAIITEAGRRRLGLKENDALWAIFSAAAVVIHAD